MRFRCTPGNHEPNTNLQHVLLYNEAPEDDLNGVHDVFVNLLSSGAIAIVF